MTTPSTTSGTTRSTSRVSTTTSTTPHPSIKIIARNSQNNQSVTEASGTFTLHQREGLVTIAQDAKFDSNGYFICPISSNCQYIVETEAAGFTTHTVEVAVACVRSGCDIVKMVVMSPHWNLDKPELWWLGLQNQQMWTFMLWPSRAVTTACAELGTNIRMAVLPSAKTWKILRVD